MAQSIKYADIGLQPWKNRGERNSRQKGLTTALESGWSTLEEFSRSVGKAKKTGKQDYREASALLSLDHLEVRAGQGGSELRILPGAICSLQAPLDKQMRLHAGGTPGFSQGSISQDRRVEFMV